MAEGLLGRVLGGEAEGESAATKPGAEAFAAAQSPRIYLRPTTPGASRSRSTGISMVPRRS
jgi:hypothetical protein